MPSFRQRLTAHPTSPIETALSPKDVKRFQREYIDLCHRIWPQKLVAFHKERIGQQSGTFRGSEFRFWVWDNPDDGWRVFINNKKGIAFELYPGVKPLVAWGNYLERLEKSQHTGHRHSRGKRPRKADRVQIEPGVT